jgi:uncharacterized protein YggE
MGAFETDPQYGPAFPFPLPVTVAVRGEANVEADPELCEFALTVQARGPERAAVIARLTERNNEALAQIKGAWPDALETIQSSGLSVYPEAKTRGRGEAIKAYSGSVRIQVVVKDLTVLGDMMVRLADAEGRSVDGPYWRLRRDSPVYSQARNEAVAEAVSRAKEYAAAIGARITGLLELADAGLSAHGVATATPRSFGTMALSAGSAAYSGPAMDLEPVRQNVYASVEARFSATQPGSL